MAARHITLKSGGKTLSKGLEWGHEQASPVMVLIASDRLPVEWGMFAEAMGQKYHVIALENTSSVDLLSVLRVAGDAPVLVAHGDAARQACAVAAAYPDSLAALVLADYSPVPGQSQHEAVSVPAMVLRGRQSRLLPHADAVALHVAMPGSRLIEPEDCGDWPFGSCPEACATAVNWFLSELSSPFMQFVVEGEREPVDPKPKGDGRNRNRDR
ncbi:MAG: alpha/beta hydrolase [Dehalococcoidia bacterium]|nr:alpha/beta hydrolase [Dehalococcoidia bacterium]